MRLKRTRWSLVTCVAGMLFAVDHKGEVDAALLSRRITYSKEMQSEWYMRAGKLSGWNHKTQTSDELLRPCSHLRLSVVRLTVFSNRSSVTVSPISQVDSLSYKTMMWADNDCSEKLGDKALDACLWPRAVCKGQRLLPHLVRTLTC